MGVGLVQGDITDQRVDAIVNAANSGLLGGGGVDGAIHRRGGPEILAACRELRAGPYPAGLPAGDAVATAAGRLSARWVIHTVGPVYRREADQSETLRSCYRSSLRVAEEIGAGSVAFPLISSGAFGWPVDDALRQAVSVLRDSPIPVVRLVLWDAETFNRADRIVADG
jgi:O-acetyl-ADP-ribose deacetylase (regulator of RNase III)